MLKPDYYINIEFKTNQSVQKSQDSLNHILYSQLFYSNIASACLNCISVRIRLILLIIIYRRKNTWIQRTNQAEDQTQLPQRPKTKINPKAITRTKNRVGEIIIAGGGGHIRKIGEDRIHHVFEPLLRKFP